MQLEYRLIAPLKSVLMLHANTLIAGVYGSIQMSQQAHLELCQMNPNNLEGLGSFLNPFVLSNSTSGKYETMPAVKQSVMGELLTSSTKFFLLLDELWLIISSSFESKEYTNTNNFIQIWERGKNSVKQ